MTDHALRKLIAVKAGKDYRDICRIVPMERPAAEPGKLVIRNRFVGVNASDINVTANVYSNGAVWDTMDLGFEAVGEVLEVGEGVEGFAPGDAVMFVAAGTAYRDIASVDASLVYHAPEVSAEMIPLLVAASTSGVGLHHIGGMKQGGETVLITAAAGGTGQMAVQWAKIAGNHVIAVCGSDAKLDTLRDLGADRVINYRSENLDAVLSAEYPNGIDLVLEAVGGEVFDTCVSHLAEMGRLIIVGCISEYLTQDDPNPPRICTSLLWKSATVRGYIVSKFPAQRREEISRAIAFWKEGKLRSVVDGTSFRSLEAIPDALDHLYAGKNVGKVTVAL